MQVQCGSDSSSLLYGFAFAQARRAIHSLSRFDNNSAARDRMESWLLTYEGGFAMFGVALVGKYDLIMLLIAAG